MDFNPEKPKDDKPPRSSRNKELNVIKGEVRAIGNARGVFDKEEARTNFLDLVRREQKTTRRLDKVIRKIETTLFSDEYINDMSATQLMDLYRLVSRCKDSSRNFMVRLYESAARTDLIKQYLDNKTTKDKANELNPENAQILQQIVSKIREKMTETAREENNGAESDT